MNRKKEEYYTWITITGVLGLIIIAMIFNGCANSPFGKKVGDGELFGMSYEQAAKEAIKIAELAGYKLPSLNAPTQQGADEFSPAGCSSKPKTSGSFQPVPLIHIPIKPPPIEGNCRSGYCYVRVKNIPVMNNGNKDELNKQLLFAVIDENQQNFIGVFHRYLQPDWPDGPWWPTWRMEAGAPGCIEEWHVFQSHELNGTEVLYGVAWDWANRQVWVSNMDTGDTQTLHLDNKPAMAEVNEYVTFPGYDPFPSAATFEMIDWDCSTAGNPVGCR